MLLAMPVFAASIVADRIMAVVNNEVISLTDLQKYRALFESGKTTDDSTTLKTMIDQKLLFAEAQKLEIPPPSEKETNRAYDHLRLQINGSDSFGKLKHRLSLEDTEIRQQLRQRLHINKFIQQRIRFFVFVTPDETEGYYKTHREELHGQTLEEARDEIDEILATDKTRVNLEAYLKRLRVKAVIRINRPRPE